MIAHAINSLLIAIEVTDSGMSSHAMHDRYDIDNIINNMLATCCRVDFNYDYVQYHRHVIGYVSDLVTTYSILKFNLFNGKFKNMWVYIV